MIDESVYTILKINDEERKEALRQMRQYEYSMQLDGEKDFGIRGDLL